MGDVKMAAAVGYSQGFIETSATFIIACFIGLVFFLVIHIRKKSVKKLPFAPFVTAGYVISNMLCRRLL